MPKGYTQSESAKEKMRAAWAARRAAGYISPNRGRPKPHMRGENHPRYKHGLDRLKGRIEYKEWQRAVLERDGKCVLCGSTECLETDHIKPYWKYPELRTELSNGRTLCHDCHTKHGYQIFKDPDFISAQSERIKKVWADGKRKGPSVEVREKIRNTLTGFKHSAEARQNMSEGQKRGYALGHRAHIVTRRKVI